MSHVNFSVNWSFEEMRMHDSVDAEAVAFPPSEGAVSTAICAVCWHFHRMLSCPAFRPHQHLHLTPRPALLPFHPPAPLSSSLILYFSSHKQWQSSTAEFNWIHSHRLIENRLLMCKHKQYNKYCLGINIMPNIFPTTVELRWEIYLEIFSTILNIPALLYFNLVTL